MDRRRRRLHSAVNSSGSAAAIAAGSRVPNRLEHLVGPAERVLHRVLLVEHHARPAGRTGARRGPGRRSASPVMWKAMAGHPRPGAPPAHRRRPVPGLSPGLDRQHRAVGVEQDPLRVAAEDQLADRGAPAQADHDQLGVVGLGDADEVLGGLEAAHELADVVGRPRTRRAGPGRRPSRPRPARAAVGVEVLAAPVGVDHHELGAAQLRLVDRRCRVRPRPPAWARSPPRRSPSASSCSSARTRWSGGTLPNPRPSAGACGRATRAGGRIGQAGPGSPTVRRVHRGTASTRRATCTRRCAGPCSTSRSDRAPASFPPPCTSGAPGGVQAVLALDARRPARPRAAHRRGGARCGAASPAPVPAPLVWLTRPGDLALQDARRAVAGRRPGGVRRGAGER